MSRFFYLLYDIRLNTNGLKTWGHQAFNLWAQFDSNTNGNASLYISQLFFYEKRQYFMDKEEMNKYQKKKIQVIA